MRPRSHRPGATWWGVLVVVLSTTGCQLFSRQSPPTDPVSQRKGPAEEIVASREN